MEWTVKEELCSPDIKPYYLGSITLEGYGNTRITYRIHPDDSEARIIDLIVESSHRLEGIGRELVTRAEDRFREHSITRVVGEAQPEVHEFWRKQRYQVFPNNNILKVIY